MISAAIVTSPGLQDVALAELKKLIGVSGIVKTNYIFFKAKEIDVCKVAYRSQSATRVLANPVELSSASLADLENSFKNNADIESYKKFTGDKVSFKIECDRFGYHNYKSVGASALLGKLIDGKLKAEIVNPDVLFYLLIDSEKAFFGLDLCGFDLSKRYYKVFPSPSSIRGPSAYCISSLAEKPGLFLDPLCSSGEIVIEKALSESMISVRTYEKEKLGFTKMEAFSELATKLFLEKRKKIKSRIYGYDPHMPNVHGAKKNAKVAGVQKSIRFGRCALEWLDTKFKENEVDSVATNALRCDEKQLDKLFYNLSYICSKKAKIIIAANPAVDVVAKKHSFAIDSSINIGRRPIEVYTLSKQ